RVLGCSIEERKEVCLLLRKCRLKRDDVPEAPGLFDLFRLRLEHFSRRVRVRQDIGAITQQSRARRFHGTPHPHTVRLIAAWKIRDEEQPRWSWERHVKDITATGTSLRSLKAARLRSVQVRCRRYHVT